MDQGSRPRRYFSCSTLNGRLYLPHVGTEIIYRTAEDVDAIFNPSRDRLIDTVEDLDEVLRASATRPLPFGMLFLAGGLEEEARRRSKVRP